MGRDENLLDIVVDILRIKDDLIKRAGREGKSYEDFDVMTFFQIWPNTAGGFGGVGGSALTRQRTYVLLPKNAQVTKAGKCHVYFDGKYAYSVQYSETFMKDVVDQSIESKNAIKKYE